MSFPYFKPTEKLLNDIEELLAQIGSVGANEHEMGWTRLAFSQEENDVHKVAAEILTARGYSVRVDGFGNLFGRKGPDEGLPFMIGTHLDTVINGGNFDGVVGFVVAVLAIDGLEALGKLKCPVEVCVFRAEESTRFKKACLGSRVAFGNFSPQQFNELTYDDGGGETTLAEAVRNCGFQPAILSECLGKNTHCGYAEVHIEQARVLESLDGIGIVTSIRAPERRRVTVKGKRSVKAVCSMVLTIEWICRRHAYSGLDAVGTVGKVNGFFNHADKINAVPGLVTFHLEELKTNRHRIIEAIARAHDVKLKYDDAGHGALLRVEGVTDHSGGTPMGKGFRRDALVAACEIILALDDESVRENEDIDFFVDLRSNNLDTRIRISAEIVNELHRIAIEYGVELSHEIIEETEPVSEAELDDNLKELIKAAGSNLGIDTVELPSGAGHDAMFAAKSGIPTAMIFVKSKDGLSHNPKEFTETSEIARSVVVLRDTLAATFEKGT